jgi:hypothetical protein
MILEIILVILTIILLLAHLWHKASEVLDNLQ